MREVSDIGADHVFDVIGIPAVDEQGWAMPAVGGAMFRTASPRTTMQVPIVSAVLNQIHVQVATFGSANVTRDIPVSLRLVWTGKNEPRRSRVYEKSTWPNLSAASDVLDGPGGGGLVRNVALSLEPPSLR